MHSFICLALSSLSGPFDVVKLLPDSSEFGWKIDDMINETSVFVIILFLMTVVWMLYSVFRHGPEHKAVYETGADYKSWRWTALTAALIFIVVDGLLLFHSTEFMWGTFFDFKNVETKPGVVRVEINAHQWAWNARYAGPDGKFNTADDIVVLNDLVVPQGAPVIFQITSTDVIHSFKIPGLRMMVDAVPGTVNRMWIQAKETGVFEIVCSQHCGANHYKMRGTVTVLPKAEYDRWAQVTSVNATRAFDSKDMEAHWGWDWAEHSRVE
ncbi:MAG: cytochrome c oxidase subunit II [Myxococcaceae bacterium]